MKTTMLTHKARGRARVVQVTVKPVRKTKARPLAKTEIRRSK
jgi:hypothetical protein